VVVLPTVSGQRDLALPENRALLAPPKFFFEG
jgi:retron-type reverse transcriptase